MRHTSGVAEFALRLTLALMLGGTLLVSPIAGSAAAGQRAAHVDAAQNEDGAGDGADEIEAAWDRAGCQLNPGNPTCILLGRAAACDIADRDPGCTSDSDSDGCLDISEVLAGLDPLSASDCLGDATGTPLLNCLFVHGNASCNAGGDRVTPIDCPLLARDPLCDGFGP